MLLFISKENKVTFHASKCKFVACRYIFQVDIKYNNVIAVTILGSSDNEIIAEESVQT